MLHDYSKASGLSPQEEASRARAANDLQLIAVSYPSAQPFEDVLEDLKSIDSTYGGFDAFLQELEGRDEWPPLLIRRLKTSGFHRFVLFTLPVTPLAELLVGTIFVGDAGYNFLVGQRSDVAPLDLDELCRAIRLEAGDGQSNPRSRHKPGLLAVTAGSAILALVAAGRLWQRRRAS